ncbi:hypothetical protein thalar_00853 [Litoreibacter arenae DSM 19593]|uniref:Uncharacterized protein n=1 Tax=Litoreibacter arenae DSM 19593 TaxID=1123360 RepID=S9QM53_9RHOB|nr:hypothetical protein thalar_00853 [Litoreibacter arenae DSM 19593]
MTAQRRHHDAHPYSFILAQIFIPAQFRTHGSRLWARVAPQHQTCRAPKALNQVTPR